MLKYFLEIRNRITLVTLSWVAAITASWTYKEVILFFISQPHKIFYRTSNYFILTSIFEIFTAHFQTITFIGTQFLAIYFVYNLVMFLSSALCKNEYLLCVLWLQLSFLYWILVTLGFNSYVAPTLLYFFLCSRESSHVKLYLEPKLIEYLNLYMSTYDYIIWYSQILFLLFFLIYHLDLKFNDMQDFRKIYHYFLMVFIVLSTPPDLLLQLVLVFLYIGGFEGFFFFTCLRIFYTQKYLSAY